MNNYTALHRALGRTAEPLSLDMIRQAITERVRETADLDWKAELPGKADHLKFAMDVAAMANTGGGAIVFGVAEDDAKAARIVSVEWSDVEERRLRQVASSCTHPNVRNLHFALLEEEGEQVVVLVVPNSGDVPHLVQQGSMFCAPIRDGSSHLRMDEARLAAAYRERARRQDQQGDRLERLADGALSRPGRRKGLWAVASAQPRLQRSMHLPRLTAEDCDVLTSDCSPERNPMLRNRGGWGALMWRPGFRKRVSVQRDLQHGVEWAVRVVEVHDDGAVVYARWLPEPRPEEEPRTIAASDVMEVVATGAWLARQADRLFLLDEHFDMRVEVRSEKWPIRLRMPHEHFGDMGDESEHCAEMGPVTATLNARGAIRGLASDVRSLANDIVNFAGIEDVGDVVLRGLDEFEETI